MYFIIVKMVYWIHESEYKRLISNKHIQADDIIILAESNNKFCTGVTDLSVGNFATCLAIHIVHVCSVVMNYFLGKKSETNRARQRHWHIIRDFHWIPVKTGYVLHEVNKRNERKIEKRIEFKVLKKKGKYTLHTIQKIRRSEIVAHGIITIYFFFFSSSSFLFRFYSRFHDVHIFGRNSFLRVDTHLKYSAGKQNINNENWTSPVTSNNKHKNNIHHQQPLQKFYTPLSFCVRHQNDRRKGNKWKSRLQSITSGKRKCDKQWKWRVCTF